MEVFNVISIAIIGMIITMSLLSLYAIIFHFIGKFLSKEDDLPYIATAIYLYYKRRKK
jgi:type IV secretory pathway VirB3-like protein